MLQRFILLFLVFPIQLYGQQKIVDAIKNLSKDEYLKNAGISILIQDIANNSEITSYNPNLSLSSASTAKLFATASAIEILGPNYRPQTRIYINGTISKEGVLNGDVWIRGGGDPTLGSKYFNQAGSENQFLINWADSLIKFGVKSINGNIIADGSDFGYEAVPDGWAWSDIGNYYGASFGGICIYDNIVKYYFNTGTKVGDTVQFIKTSPFIPDLSFRNYIQAANIVSDKSIIYGGPYNFDRFGGGFLPVDRSSFVVKGSIPDPELFMAQEFKTILKSKGISVYKNALNYRKHCLVEQKNYAKYKLVVTHNGPKISEIATWTNVKSLNLFAEALVGIIAYKKGSKGSTKEGLKIIENYWKNKIDTKGLFLEDGSGLSHNNGINATNFVSLLHYMQRVSVNGKSFYNTLPVAGKNGTLVDLCVDGPGQGRVVAKSGTMQRVKSYAGYINSKSGKKYAFAIIINNFSCSTNLVVNKIENILNIIAAN
jgi:D-alanyl-D-alanine carboxypeptidase/D-alanyl-D-alanine-endopeptidase (penicillin-binding protein 4)